MKLGENDGRNGKNVVPAAEMAKRRKTEETVRSRRIQWEHVKTGRKRWSEWQKRGTGGRNGLTSENGKNGPFTSNTVETLENWANTTVGMAETWYRRPELLNVVETEETAKRRKTEETDPSAVSLVNWANAMVGTAKTWYRRPKRLSLGKRKKRTVHPVFC